MHFGVLASNVLLFTESRVCSKPAINGYQSHTEQIRFVLIQFSSYSCNESESAQMHHAANTLRSKQNFGGCENVDASTGQSSDVVLKVLFEQPGQGDPNASSEAF